MDSDSDESSVRSDPIQIDVAPDGDVVLVVGPEKLRLRVYSQVLRAASKVFAVMLRPRWMDGKGPSQRHQPEISLESDDAEAMRIVCHAIHFRNDVLPGQIKPEEALRLVTVSDKYDLHDTLKHTILDYLNTKTKVTRVEMGYLTAAAYLLGDTKIFAERTLALVLDFDGSYTKFFDDPITKDILPFQLFCMFC
jgi:hypothetical protein